MIQKLIILGLLKNNPASGYDIKKFVEKDLHIFSQLSMSSIYYPLKRMEEEGLVKKKRLKGKRHLQREVYSITAKGNKVFTRLCREVLLSQRQPLIESDIALYFLPLLEKKEILPLLRLQLRFLEKVRVWLLKRGKDEAKNIPKNLALFTKHHLKLIIAEKEFIKDTIELVKKDK